MREIRKGFYDGHKKRSVTEDTLRHYALPVFFCSLEAIHDHVIGAIDVLEHLFAEPAVRSAAYWTLGFIGCANGAG